MAFWLNTYYIVVLAWAMYYVWESISWELPWRDCDNYWNSKFCRSEYDLALESRECKLRHGEDSPVCFINTTAFRSPVKEYWE